MNALLARPGCHDGLERLKDKHLLKSLSYVGRGWVANGAKATFGQRYRIRPGRPHGHAERCRSDAPWPCGGIWHGRERQVKITGGPFPVGGWKQPGHGREGSRHGLEAFSELKYLCIDTAARPPRCRNRS